MSLTLTLKEQNINRVAIKDIGTCNVKETQDNGISLQSVDSKTQTDRKACKVHWDGIDALPVIKENVPTIYNKTKVSGEAENWKRVMDERWIFFIRIP